MKNSISLYDIIANRHYSGALGWHEIPASHFLNEAAIEEIVSLVEGRLQSVKSTRKYLQKAAKGISMPVCGLLKRIERIQYEHGLVWEYTAGQDYQYELNEVRKFMRKNA